MRHILSTGTILQTSARLSSSTSTGSSPGKPKSYIRWGDIVDNWFVRNAYDLPVLKANGRRKYSDEFEKAYLEYFNERKEDLK